MNEERRRKNEERKRIKEINKELTNEVFDLVFNNPNEFIKELWNLITVTENYATTMEHLECYEFYTQKKDLSEYYTNRIEEESKEVKEIFLKFVKKYNE